MATCVEIPTENGKIVIGEHKINNNVKKNSVYLLVWENNVCVKHEHGLYGEDVVKYLNQYY